jgi:BlaI family transcriptional regulator, penicillinase repressor
MPNPLPHITDAEWAVMDVIWNEHPIAAQDVITALERSTEWSATTVKTLLARLVEKGALEFQRDGRRFLYEPKVTRSQAVTRESRSFLDRVFQGEASPLLSHFVRNARLSSREIAELRRLLEEKEARS